MSGTATRSGKGERLLDLVKSKEGFIFDLDGTVYLGDHLIAGADRAIAMLRGMGKKLIFVSNKPIATRQSYADKLNRLGVPCSVEEVINSSLVCARYLQKHYPGAQVFPVGEPPLVEELKRHGMQITDDPRRIQVVVVAFDRTFNYRKLDIAYRAALNGAALIATNPDRTCPMPGYELPDAACMIAAIEACTLRKVEPIVGKPSEIMLAEAMDLLGLPPGQCVMFGDRLETDLMMAKRAGISFVLVLSGVTRPGQVDSAPFGPDLVLESIAEVAALGPL